MASVIWFGIHVYVVLGRKGLVKSFGCDHLLDPVYLEDVASPSMLLKAHV